MPERSFHVLLVDDEIADAELFTEIFMEAFPEVQIRHVLNGREALDHLDRAGTARPDLIILDLNMPVMNGHDFLQRAKAHDTHRDIPILVLSTSSGEDDVQRSYHNFASGYAVKPASYQDLQALVDRISGYWQGAVILPRIEQVTD
ncbi:response regulator [Deinococcus radiotolerans]|uniref:Response regulator n=1 Tax=Deinococcus radiotolerans TaxID=1309407 RepID=A0ABQ2FQV1_9DEIO|nr:response regulator [Deinococcus radiotolerans]GGL18018.1 response regulator [Deinococcus radiotolerans]